MLRLAVWLVEGTEQLVKQGLGNFLVLSAVQ